MILALIELRLEFDNIQEHILTGSSILSFDDVFARLLRHSSTATQSRCFEVTLDTSVILSQSLPCNDSRSFCRGNRGWGQRSHCTYCNWVGHTRDRCYQLHGRPPRITA